jgi:hypothetical protein
VRREVKPRIVAIAVVMSISVAAPTLAQTQGYIDQCNGRQGATPDQRVVACGELIRAGRLQTNDLVAVLLSRADAYLKKRDLDLAINDLDEAIRINPLSDAAFYM